MQKSFYIWVHKRVFFSNLFSQSRFPQIFQIPWERSPEKSGNNFELPLSKFSLRESFIHSFHNDFGSHFQHFQKGFGFYIHREFFPQTPVLKHFPGSLEQIKIFWCYWYSWKPGSGYEDRAKSNPCAFFFFQGEKPVFQILRDLSLGAPSEGSGSLLAARGGVMWSSPSLTWNVRGHMDFLWLTSRGNICKISRNQRAVVLGQKKAHFSFIRIWCPTELPSHMLAHSLFC